MWLGLLLLWELGRMVCESWGFGLGWRVARIEVDRRVVVVWGLLRRGPSGR